MLSTINKIIIMMLMSTAVMANNMESFSEKLLLEVKEAKVGMSDSELSIEDPMQQYKDDFKGVLGSITIPDISLDSKSFGFEFNPSFDTQITTTPNKIKSSNVPISQILSFESKEDRIQNYMNFKCSSEKNRISGGGGGMNQSLTSSVNDMLGQIEDMESDIKSQVASQVSQTFKSISSLFTPEYLIELTLTFFTTKLAEATCTTCSITKLGCDSVFLIGEIYSQVAEIKAEEAMSPSISVTKQGEVQGGSYFDYTFGSGCPTNSVLSGIAGVSGGGGKEIHKESMNKITRFVESAKMSVEEAVWNRCVEQEQAKVIDLINQSISAATSQIELNVETQKSCQEENSSPTTFYQKSGMARVQKSEFFNKLNNFIDKEINQPGQKYTKTAMDVLNRTIETINSAPRAVDVAGEVSEIIGLMDSSMGTAAMQYEKLKYAEESIRGTSFHPSIKESIIKMVESAFRVTQLSVRYKEKFKEMVDDISITTEDSTNTQSKILLIREDYHKNIDFYNKSMLDDSMSITNNNSSHFICQEFKNSTPSCYTDSYIEHLTGFTNPNSCECNKYGMVLDILTNPFTISQILLKTHDNDIKKAGVSDATQPNFIGKLMAGTNELERMFIVELASQITTIQSGTNRILIALPKESQDLVKSEFKKLLKVIR